MTTASTITTHEAQIRQLIADQQRAICAKDVDQIMSRYAEVILDVKPPFQTQGKRLSAKCGKTVCFSDTFEIETRDLIITVSENLAVAHWLFRFMGTEVHPAQMWMRVTAVCQKNQGEWQIRHEHLSVPFDPETSKAGRGSKQPILGKSSRNLARMMAYQHWLPDSDEFWEQELVETARNPKLQPVSMGLPRHQLWDSCPLVRDTHCA